MKMRTILECLKSRMNHSARIGRTILALLIMSVAILFSNPLQSACNSSDGGDWMVETMEISDVTSDPSEDNKEYELLWDNGSALPAESITWKLDDESVATFVGDANNSNPITVQILDSSKAVTLTATMEGEGDCSVTLDISGTPMISLSQITLDSAEFSLPTGTSSGAVDLAVTLTFDIGSQGESLDGDYVELVVKNTQTSAEVTNTTENITGLGGRYGFSALSYTLSISDLEIGEYTLTATFYHDGGSSGGKQDGTDSVDFSVSADIEAEFKATAPGERTAADGETLVFADDGKDRSITFNVDTSDTFIPDYPKWSGITGTDGSTSTTESIKVDKTATVNLTPNQEKSITVDFQPNSKKEVSIDFGKGTAGKDIIDQINLVLGKLNSTKLFSAPTGSVKISTEFVDKYQDGSKLGFKYTGTGEISSALGDFETPEITVPVVTGINGFIKAKFTGVTINGFAEGTYDESKSTPGNGAAGIGAKLGCSIEGGFKTEDAGGVVPSIGLIVEGSVGISGEAKIEAADSKFYLKGKAGAKNVTITVKGEIILPGGIDYTAELATFNPFGGDLEKEISVEL